MVEKMKERLPENALNPRVEVLVATHIILKPEHLPQREEAIVLAKEAICRDHSVAGNFQIAETTCSDSHSDVNGLGEGEHLHIEITAKTNGSSRERR